MFFVQEHFAKKRADRTALFSPDDPDTGRPTYRYALGRTWDWNLPRLYVVMVNPSTADAEADDPTIMRLTAFGRRWGYGGLGVVNLFSLISPDPKALDIHPDPVGSSTVAMHVYVLVRAKKEGSPVLVAWGNNGFRSGLDRAFVMRAKREAVPLICLGLTQDGHPKHPLARGQHRVPDDFDPIPFDPPWIGQTTIGVETVALHPDGRPVCIRCDGGGRLALETQCHRCKGSGEHPNPFGEQPCPT